MQGVQHDGLPRIQPTNLRRHDLMNSPMNSMSRADSEAHSAAKRDESTRASPRRTLLVQPTAALRAMPELHSTVGLLLPNPPGHCGLLFRGELSNLQFIYRYVKEAMRGGATRNCELWIAPVRTSPLFRRRYMCEPGEV